LSRLPSTRSSSSAGASSSARSSPAAARRPGVLVQSPKSDIYVVLLGVSLGAILVSCIIMIVVFYRYGFSTKVSAIAPAAAATAIA
jgi:hypothetical protein